MKVSIITTVDHNVGDDFVREGIKYLIRKHFDDEELDFQNIHKHSPITSRYGFEWFRNLRYSSRVDNLIPNNWFKDRVFEADILIQSGAPVYWCHKFENNHCCNNEWYKPLVEDRYIKKTGHKKLLNLAAGTCQTYDSDGSEFCESCLAYIERFYKLADVTTVRDNLSAMITTKLGFDLPVIPCSSIFAIDEHSLKSQEGEYVVVNYMKGGAHYTFGQEIDFDRWEKEFRRFYNALKQREKVVIVCHNQQEYDEAICLDLNADIFFKENDYVAYMEFYSKARFGIVNRVHAGFMMASYGKPSVVIGNDSRALMAVEVGLRHYFVNDVNYDLLMNEYESLKSEVEEYSSKFQVIKEKAFQDYMGVLSEL